MTLWWNVLYMLPRLALWEELEQPEETQINAGNLWSDSANHSASTG